MSKNKTKLRAIKKNRSLIKTEELNSDFENTKPLVQIKSKLLKESNDQKIDEEGISCTCGNECNYVLTENEKKEIYEKFIQLKNDEEKITYIQNAMHFKNSTNSSTRSNSTLVFMIDLKKTIFEICWKAFIDLHGLDKTQVEKIILKTKRGGSGGKICRNERDDDTIIKIVREFIRSSYEFKSSNNQVKACYTKFKNEYKNKYKMPEYKFSNIFNEEINSKLTRCCRICLNVSNELVNIFSKLNDNTDEMISERIMQLAPIQILKYEEHLPKLICKYCVGKLIASLDFRQLCIDSDLILRTNTTTNNSTQKHSNHLQDGNELSNIDNSDYLNEFLKDEETVEDDVTIAIQSNDTIDQKLSQNKQLKPSNHLIIKNKYIEVNKESTFRIKKHPQYQHQKHKLVNPKGKVQGGACTCPRKCYSLISKKEREKIFENFWSIRKRYKQSCYIHDCLQALKIKRKTKQNEQLDDYIDLQKPLVHKKTMTIAYRVPIYGGRYWVRVCQKAFQNLHGLNRQFIRQIMKVKRTILHSKLQQNNFDGDNQLIKNEDVGATTTTSLSDEYFSSDKSDDDLSKPKYQCNICYVKCNAKSSLRYHKKKNNHYTIEDQLRKEKAEKFKPNANGQYFCYDCSALFLEKKKLMGHRKRVHTNKIYTCEICGEVYHNYRQFHYHKEKFHHQQRHNNDKVLPNRLNKLSSNKNRYEINKVENRCDKNDLFDLKRFENVQPHPPPPLINPFQCNFCGVVFAQSNLLSEHVILLHCHQKNNNF